MAQWMALVGGGALAAVALAFMGGFALTISAEELEERIAETIIAMEKAALDRWGHGDPGGYLEISAQEVTYFDPDLEKRLDGIDALRKLYETIRGKVSVDRFEMIDPRVQVHGNVAILTFNLIDHSGKDEGRDPAKSRWNSTETYARVGGEWRIIHTHWSYTKPAK